MRALKETLTPFFYVMAFFEGNLFLVSSIPMKGTRNWLNQLPWSEQHVEHKEDHQTLSFKKSDPICYQTSLAPVTPKITNLIDEKRSFTHVRVLAGDP